MDPAAPAVPADFPEKVAFLTDLSARLHAYGTTSQRLEGAIHAMARRLGVRCEPWSNPTGMVLAVRALEDPDGHAQVTRVLRLPPGDTDLFRLCEADRIAEEVAAGRMGIRQARTALAALDGHVPGRSGQALMVLAFGAAAAGVAGLLRLPWLDIATAAVAGLLIGLLQLAMQGRPRLTEAGDAIAGLVAGSVAVLVASLAGPLNFNTVVIASLIVLLPGLTLTNAMTELASQSVVAGSARFAGAVTTVMKLSIGTVIAYAVASALGLEPQVRALRPQPAWVEWISLLALAVALAVLFRTGRRDYPVVIAAVVLGYAISKFAALAWGSTEAIFVASLAMTALGNGYARWTNRPGALVRVPGLIALVPGSASLRGMLQLVQQQDLAVGESAVLGVLNVLLALVAGLLFGNLLLPARRYL